VLYVFGFERVGVVLGDLYFVDPAPAKGQEGAEHGVRLELRVLERGALKGSIYSAQPIEVGRPVWRADFLESVDGKPLGWLAGQLKDLDGLLAEAGFPADTAGPEDAQELRDVAPEIVDATRRLLDRVRAGELGNPPRPATVSANGAGDDSLLVRSGWL
jgi:hypothetical protein